MEGRVNKKKKKRSSACFLTLTFTGLIKLNMRFYKSEDERSNETPPSTVRMIAQAYARSNTVPLLHKFSLAQTFAES